MIVLKIKGGLGNQMFQYAFGRAINEKTGKTLVLDISDYKYDKSRKFSLDHFYLNKSIIVDDSGKYNFLYDSRINPFIRLGNKFCPEKMWKYAQHFGIYIWDYAKYKEINNIDMNRNKIFIHGLWHSEVYFNEIKDIICKELLVKDMPSTANEKIISSILESDSVCVHIRRGDFLLEKNSILAQCSNNYYKKAMQYIENKIKKPVYYIFSDDIDDVKKNFDFENRKVIFVELKNPDYEEIRLMYNCQHFILANSTFGWWASYMADRINGITIAPSTWYTDGRDITHLLRQRWILLNN